MPYLVSKLKDVLKQPYEHTKEHGTYKGFFFFCLLKLLVIEKHLQGHTGFILAHLAWICETWYGVYIQWGFWGNKKAFETKQQ